MGLLDNFIAEEHRRLGMLSELYASAIKEIEKLKIECEQLKIKLDEAINGKTSN